MGQGPYRQDAVAVIGIQHAVDHTGDELRVDEVLQRSPGTEHIPKGERGVERRLVAVTDEVGSDHRVVQRGVEHRAEVLAAAFHLDDA